jgi:hypothetical protein
MFQHLSASLINRKVVIITLTLTWALSVHVVKLSHQRCFVQPQTQQFHEIRQLYDI